MKWFAIILTLVYGLVMAVKTDDSATGWFQFFAIILLGNIWVSLSKITDYIDNNKNED